MSWIKQFKDYLDKDADLAGNLNMPVGDLVPLKSVAEIVLSDGRLCVIYPVRLWHLTVAQDEDMYKQFAKLVALTVTIDGNPVNAQEVYEMPMRDIEAIGKHIK